MSLLELRTELRASSGRDPSPVLSEKCVSFSDDSAPHHFKGNPLYQLIKNRWHLAHPQPEKLSEHLQPFSEGKPPERDIVDGGGTVYGKQRTHLKIFGWERQDWEGGRFGDLDDARSEHVARMFGVGTEDELIKRLTAGIPHFKDAYPSYRLYDRAESQDWDSQLYEVQDRYDDWEYSSNGGGIHREKDDGDTVEYYHPHDQTFRDHQPEFSDPRNHLRPCVNVELGSDISHAHGELGQMSREIYYGSDGDKHAYQEIWRLPDNKQGSGISTLVYQSQEEMYEAAGVSNVYLHANIDVGGYAWAQQGYDALEGEDDAGSSAPDSDLPGYGVLDSLKERIQRPLEDDDEDSDTPSLSEAHRAVTWRTPDDISRVELEDLGRHDDDISAAQYEDSLAYHWHYNRGRHTDGQIAQHLYKDILPNTPPEEASSGDVEVGINRESRRRQQHGIMQREADEDGGRSDEELRRFKELDLPPHPYSPGEEALLRSYHEQAQGQETTSEVRERIEAAEHTWELANVRVSPNLATRHGLDSLNLGKDSLLGSDWWGFKPLRSGSPSPGQVQGYKYRAGKLMALMAGEKNDKGN